MPTDDFPTFQRGDRKIPAAYLNGVARAVEALRDPMMPGGGRDFDQPVIAQDAEPTFRARITGKSAATPPAYQWILVDDLDLGYSADDAHAAAVTGGDGQILPPAYEESGNAAVPVDGSAIVRLWPSASRNHYWFSWQPWGGTFSAPVTFTSTVTWSGTSSAVYQSGSSLTLNAGSTLTTAATVNVTGGTWTYGSTASASTAPTSRLVVPTLTGAGPPTYAGTVGEILCVGGRFYQYGTSWVGYAPDPLTTKGDLWAFDGTTDVRQPAGTDGFLLKADSGTSTGLAYVDPATLTAGLPSAPVAVTLGGTPTLSTVRQWFKVTGISRTDFSTAGTTRTITAVVLPAKGIIHEAVIKSTAAFTGGSIATYKVDLKISGNTVIGLYDVLAAPGNTNFGNDDESNTYLGKPWNFGATVNVELTATSTGANLSAATAGALDLYLEMSKLE